jgi:hypothetical protein
MADKKPSFYCGGRLLALEPPFLAAARRVGHTILSIPLDATDTFKPITIHAVDLDVDEYSAARSAGLALAVCCCSCYFGGGLGPTFPAGTAPPSKAGANAALEIGLTYDYKRLVRATWLGQIQQFGGAVFTADGQHVVAPLTGGLGVDVTVWKLDPNFLLRATARGYYGSGVRVGPLRGEIEQASSSAFGGLLGATIHLASTPDTEEGVGPSGLSLTLGLLVARASEPGVGSQGFLAPMLFAATEFSPPHILYCWFVNEKCPHFLHPVKN